jgi:hypothetical protein
MVDWRESKQQKGKQYAQGNACSAIWDTSVLLRSNRIVGCYSSVYHGNL